MVYRVTTPENLELLNEFRPTKTHACKIDNSVHSEYHVILSQLLKLNDTCPEINNYLTLASLCTGKVYVRETSCLQV